MRIHVFLAHQGIASRRKAESMITEHKVRVNGELATIGQQIDPTKDRITVEGKVVSFEPTAAIYVAINKPVGIVSSTSDELGRKTVLDMIPLELTQKHRLYPVGRLDLDSQGLMLLTDDGQLTYHLTHPSHEVGKTYHVKILGEPTDKALNHLRRGVKLREGYTQPAEVEIMEQNEDSTWLSITIHEGKYRQVRRMFERIGYEVVTLIRHSIGTLTLDELAGQPYILLSAERVSQL